MLATNMPQIQNSNLERRITDTKSLTSGSTTLQVAVVVAKACMHSVSLSCSVFSNGLGNVAFHKKRKNINFIEIDIDAVLCRYIIWKCLFVFYTNIPSHAS